jgi:hypothetical protein
MKTIGDLLSRDLDRKIEEIIQVDQADEQSVHDEITEYVATGSIKDQYAQLLKAIADAPTEANESVGVWVSGFFGSGKSSFAKNLGYALQNRQVLGDDFATLFKRQIGDKRIGELLDLINLKMPTEVILFEVAKERDTRKVTERIAELMYTVLLRELGYAEDFDIAELEIELEGESELDRFVEACQTIHKLEWKMVRKGAQKLSRASAVLHHLDRTTYPSADSWSHAQRNRDAAITVSKVVERTFELMGRRRPGKALVFIIDEVGQHVARSGDKIEDLRATVEEFGKVGKNLLKARKIPAPCWVVVTSQEKLDEVVSALGDDKRIDLAKLQDRFRHRVDLAPSDIREVATKRVLAKKEDAEPVLKKLFAENQGSLNAALRLERSTRRTDLSEADFVQFYPYMPHYIDLCIGIVSGIRLQPGAPRHYGGSNRTIIKQAYEMLVSERTALARQPVGILVTLDKVYELVEGNLSSEKRGDIHEIGQRFKDNPDDGGWAVRVAKVICLLEFLRDLPRTEPNIAAFLVDQVGQAAPVERVKEAVKRLHAAQFIRSTEEGWKLQTAQEKTWETERRGYLEPKPRERNEITRTVLREIFGEPALKTYRHKEHRNFRLGVAVEGVTLEDGDLTLTLSIADDPDELARKTNEVREESRQKAHENDLYWAFALTPEIDELVAQAFASRKMVEKYDQLRAQNKISTDESACLQDEKNSVMGYEARLRDKLVEAMERGTGMFRGVARDASSLGKGLGEILKKVYGQAIPDLYPKLELGSRPLKGTEAEEFLKAADLKALPPLFYDGEQGLALVTKDGSKYVPNPAAPVAKEVLDYLIGEHGYGNKESRTGKVLEKKFGGIGYGWDRDMLRLILAVLFRAGSIEITHGGEKFDDYKDPRSRTPLVNNTAFKSALFTPVKPIDLPTLKRAVESYEDLTGGTVDMDKAAIAEALKAFAAGEIKRVLPVEAQAKAHGVPVLGTVGDYRESLATIESGSADDCVTILAGGGVSLKQGHDRVRKIADCLDEKGLATLRNARRAVGEVWNLLDPEARAQLQPKANAVRELLSTEALLDSLSSIQRSSREILGTYRTQYESRHADRTEQFRVAIEKIKGRDEWTAVPEAMREPVLAPLQSRCCDDPKLPDGSLACESCRAGLSQMESDVAALGGLIAQVVAQVQKLITPPDVPLRRVRVADFFAGTLEDEEQVRQSVARLQDYLLKLLSEGVKIVVE